MEKYIVLPGGVIQKIDTSTIEGLLEWANWYGDAHKRGFMDGGCIVQQDQVTPDIFVSTVFLSIDHSFSMAEDVTPVLFETKIFVNDKSNDYVERYTTYEDALEGHKQALVEAEKLK